MTQVLSLEQVSKDQLNKMKHALGMNRKKKPYRNYFFLYNPSEEWEDLVNKGFAKRNPGMAEGSVYYYVTYEAVKLLYGKPISKKYYETEM